MVNLISFQSIWAVTNRHIKTWMQQWKSSLAVNVVNPLLFLFAFGVGMGAIISNMDGMPYLTYVVAGMLAQAVMFSSSFEMSINCHTRITLQRFHDGVLATSVTLQDLLLGEILWATLKASISGFSVLIVGLLWGGVIFDWSILFVIPLIFLGGAVFAATGLALTAYAKGFEFFAYFFTFWTTPMFMFSGVFFPVSRLPEWIQHSVQWLPMKPWLDMMRSITSGHNLSISEYSFWCFYLLLMTFVAYVIAYKKFKNRFFD